MTMNGNTKNTKHSAINKLYVTHFDTIFQFFRVKTSDCETARELTHDTFLKLLERGNIEHLESASQKSYLQKCAKHNLVDYYKCRDKKQQLIEQLECRHKAELESRETGEQFYLRNEILGNLYKTINDSLTETEQKILFQKYYDNESINAICVNTGISRYRLERILYYITTRIRDTLMKYY